MTRRFYFNHSELDFSGVGLSQDILEMHLLSEEHAHALLDDGFGYAYVEFDDSDQVSASGYIGEYETDVLASLAQNIKSTAQHAAPYRFSPNANPAHSWVQTPDGQSRFGGPAPLAYIFPNAEFVSGYQYLGFLSNSDLPIPVQGDGLHLIYPMLIGRPPLFLDYSNPLEPKLVPLNQCFMSLGGQDLHNCAEFYKHYGSGVTYPEIEALFEPGEQLIYQPVSVSRRPITVEQHGDADASHPDWIQYPEIPMCPKTKEPMLFLGMIGTGMPPIESALIKRARASLDRYDFDYFFGGLMFWGGNWPAFLFYHPTGQTLSIHPQAT